MKKRSSQPEFPALKEAITSANGGMCRIMGLWELVGEEGYDELDAPDGWDEKRYDAIYRFDGDGTGKHISDGISCGEYDLRWKLEGDLLTVVPAYGTEPAIYTVSAVDQGTIRLESKIKDEAGPYWKYYNRATYVKKTDPYGEEYK